MRPSRNSVPHDDSIVDLVDAGFQSHQQFTHATIFLAGDRAGQDCGASVHGDVDAANATARWQTVQGSPGGLLDFGDRPRWHLDGGSQSDTDDRFLSGRALASEGPAECAEQSSQSTATEPSATGPAGGSSGRSAGFRDHSKALGSGRADRVASFDPFEHTQVRLGTLELRPAGVFGVGLRLRGSTAGGENGGQQNDRERTTQPSDSIRSLEKFRFCTPTGPGTHTGSISFPAAEATS